MRSSSCSVYIGLTGMSIIPNYCYNNSNNYTEIARVGSLFHRPKAHPASFLMNIRGAFTRQSTRPATQPNLVSRLNIFGAMPPRCHMSSWRGAQLSIQKAFLYFVLLLLCTAMYLGRSVTVKV